jgi:hypothetical protein
MNITFKLDRTLYPKRGIGVWFRFGDLGSDYGDPRAKLFVDIVVLLFAWQWVLHFFWRRT